MTEADRFESMTRDQLLETALNKNIPGTSKLNKRELIGLLRRLHDLETFPRTKLLNRIREFQITGSRRMTKRRLALLVLQAERFENMKIADLRTLARKEEAGSVSQLRKKEIVKQLLDSYADSLRPDTLHSKPKSSLGRRLHASRRQPWKKWLGRAVQVASAVGIFLTMVGLVVVPMLASRFSSILDDALLTISQEASMAAVSLKQVDLIIEEGVQTLEAAEASLWDLDGSMEETQPFIHSTADLLTDHTPEIVEDTREALLSVEEGAQAVDQVLRNLAAFRFVTGVTYDPEKPLDEGISGVTSTLEPLPDALREVGGELNRAGDSLDEVRKSLGKMAEELRDFADEMSRKYIALTDLAEDLESISGDLNKARDMIDQWVLIGTIVIELLLLGHLLGQAAIFYVGRDMARGGHPPKKSE